MILAAATNIPLPFNPADYYPYILPALTALIFIAHMRGYKLPILSAIVNALTAAQPKPDRPMGPNVMGFGASSGPLVPRSPLHEQMHTHSLLLCQIGDDVQFVKQSILDSQRKTVAERVAPSPDGGCGVGPAPATPPVTQG